MIKPKLLDLFCCAGGAAVGYDRAGFCVVGVDIKPQPNYPFPFIQADALEYANENHQYYQAFHASPPCQEYSVTRNLHDNSYPDLLVPTRELLQWIDKPYIIENVPGSPMKNYIALDGTMFPETLRVIRQRYFESNVLLLAPSRGKKLGYTSGRGKGYSSFDDGYYVTVAGHNYRFSDGCVAMGINWMNQAELSQSIPPIYTEYLGRQLIRYVA